MVTNLKKTMLERGPVISVFKTESGRWFAELQQPTGEVNQRVYGMTSPSVNELQFFASEVLGEEQRITSIRYEDCTLMAVQPKESV